MSFRRYFLWEWELLASGLFYTRPMVIAATMTTTQMI